MQSITYRADMRKPSFFDFRRWQFYIVVGLAYMLLWTLGERATEPEAFPERQINIIWRGVYIIFANYLFFEYIIPRLSLKKPFLSLGLLFAQFLIFSFGLYAWRCFGIALHIYTSQRVDKSLLDGVCYHFPYSVASAFFYGVVKHFYDHIKLRQTAQQLRIEKQAAELNYLKSQTNPHFLFNTLNNIYSLANDKSDLAPESILRLSEILRFMLYQTSAAYISIEQEIKIINDYIALEKLRYDDSLAVQFERDVQDMKQKLPPLLLIPLVENAFKHGASETLSRPFVHIHLSIRDERLSFSVKNSTGAAPDEAGVKEKIGLSNLRRQLELLYADYELTIEQGDAAFTTILKINLDSHV